MRKVFKNKKSYHFKSMGQNDVQKKYYHENKTHVRMNRTKSRIIAGLPVRAATIHKYQLVSLAKERGYETEYIPSANRIDATIRNKVSDEIASKVETRLAQVDKEIAKMVALKKEQAENVARGVPQLTGPITIDHMLERIPLFSWEESTSRKRKGELIKLFGPTMLNDKGDDTVSTFNDNSNVMKVIEQYAKDHNLKDGGALYYNLCPAFVREMPDFRSQITNDALVAYKNRHKSLSSIANEQRHKRQQKEVYLPFEEIDLVRRRYANEYPGSVYHAVAALYTLHPSVRNDYGCVVLIKNGSPVNDKIRNFYNVDTGEIILNFYKTGKSYGSIRAIFNPELKRVLDLYLETSGNKKYLFSKKNYRPSVKQESLDSMCAKQDHPSDMNDLIMETFNFYLKKKATTKNFGVQQIRPIWASHLKEQERKKLITSKERGEFVRLMAHSLETAETVYIRKIGKLKASTTKAIQKYPDYGEDGYKIRRSEITSGKFGDRRKFPNHDHWRVLTKRRTNQPPSQGKSKTGKKKKKT